MSTYEILTFPSRLGWMAVVSAGTTVKQLTFGHRSAAAAKAALDPWLSAEATLGDAMRPLAARLQAYAEGSPDNFHDVRVDLRLATEFQRRVIAQCRRVKYGETTTYAELAARAGYEGAARAVGNCMAANSVPLIVPCHRVVRADGRLGYYSAEGGTETKRRLLVLECAE